MYLVDVFTVGFAYREYRQSAVPSVPDELAKGRLRPDLPGR